MGGRPSHPIRTVQTAWVSLLIVVMLLADCVLPAPFSPNASYGDDRHAPSAIAAPLTQTGCSPRPPVTLRTEPDREGRRVRVTITAGAGALREVRFGPATNGTLELPGFTAPSAGNVTVTPPPGTRELTFQTWQTAQGAAFLAPMNVVDGCGEWSTFVGGGAQWWATPTATVVTVGSTAIPTPTATPTVTATPTITPTATVTPTATLPSEPTPPLPPDPSSVAPPLDRSVVTTLKDATSFLYSGSNPIQTGLTATIAPERAAVLRGKALKRDGSPLAGTVVKVLGRPEYGQTVSRTDGAYDLAVNGGGLLTLTFDRIGYLSGQRQVDAPWQNYAIVADVALVPLDPMVTSVQLGAGAPAQVQVARGSTQTDAEGARQATLLFPAGVQATMKMPNGSIQPLSTLSVRATEYTVGANGPKMMPAPLPPQSGYTYAVELSVDEAMAAGATEVTFDRPVPFYVENFLSFPVGMAVPAGYYDRQKAEWIASDNGRVVRVLRVEAGLAILQVDGSGQAASPSALSALGVDDAERARLATLYQPGVSLWRVPVRHFTPWDHNWPYGPPPGARGPGVPGPDNDDETDDPECSGGSIIECENQNLGQTIPIVGTPFRLHYSSARSAGRTANRTLGIRLSEDSMPSGVVRIDLEVEVAGRKTEQTFTPGPNQGLTFTWDGLDAFGRAVNGSQETKVRVGYVYPAIYQEPAAFEQAFGALSGVPISGSEERQEVTLWQEHRANLGAWDASSSGIGNWTIDAVQLYDALGRSLYGGDGSRRSAAALRFDSIVTEAGGGGGGNGNDNQDIGDGGPATAAGLNGPQGVAVGPDGSLFIADTRNNRVRRVGTNGVIATVAGSGVSAFSGDGGPATAAGLNGPQGVAVGPDGSLYIADTLNNRVRRVGTNGIIATVAGSGVSAFSGDGGPATAAALSAPQGVAVGPDGSLYIADTDNRRVRRVGPDTLISTVAGTGANGFSGDGGPAPRAGLASAPGIAVSGDGSLQVTDAADHRVRRVGADGIIATAAGIGPLASSTATPLGSFSGDGGPATAAGLNGPKGVAVGPDGSLYIADTLNNRVRRVGPDKVITTVAGNGLGAFLGDGGPATAARLNGPQGVAVGPDGSLYISDTLNNRIRRVWPPLPGFDGETLAISSADGKLIYSFDAAGRHRRTVNAVTGVAELEFGYDSARRLVTITDGDGNVTTIQRDGQGRPTAIVGPFGQTTRLALNGNGLLASITNPANETHGFEYASGGLLTSFTDPKGNTKRYTYDAVGRLIRAEDPAPAGGSKSLSRQTVTPDVADRKASGHRVTLTTVLGRATRYLLERLTTSDTRRIVTEPDGATSTREIGTNGTTRTTASDGSVTEVTEGPDPRFGMQAPVTSNATVRSPAGRIQTTTNGRTATLADPNNPLSLTSLTETTSVNGRVFTRAYVGANRTFTDTTPTGRARTTTIDAQGRVVSEQVAGLAPTTYGYDTRGRLATITQGSGAGARTTTLAYSAAGFLQSISDPAGRTVSFTHDSAGRPLTQTLPGNRVVAFGYDANGSLTSLAPPGRPAHTFGYTSVDLPSTYTPPAVPGVPAAATVNTYNPDRQLTNVALPTGQSIGLAYDAAGRLSAVTLPRGQTTYSYDASGRASGVAAPGGIGLSYSYDGFLVTGESWTGPITGAVGWTYDNDLRVSAQTVNGGSSVTLAYDNDSLLTGVGALTLTRGPQHGLVLGSTLGSVTDAWGYSPFGEPEAYTASVSGSDVLRIQYARDALGRITTKTETTSGGTDTYGYTYDPAGRLFEVRKNGALTASYTYDANGNRLTAPNLTGTATYDDQDRLLQYGANTYTYTADGRLLTKVSGGQTTTYGYDELGNLLTATLPDGTQLEYLVDGRNRRVGKRVNGTLVQGFLYDGQLRPIAELDGAGAVVSRFVYGSRLNVPEYMVRGGSTYRIVADHLGGPRLVIDTATGTVVQRLEYDEWGNVLTDTSPGFQPFAFAGGLHDRDTNLVRFGARDYDPETGRWTTKDPLLLRRSDRNLYLYARDDPVNHLDQNGMFFVAAVAMHPVIFGAFVAFGSYVSRDAMGAFSRAVAAAQAVGIDIDDPMPNVVGEAVDYALGVWNERDRIAASCSIALRHIADRITAGQPLPPVYPAPVASSTFDVAVSDAVARGVATSGSMTAVMVEASNSFWGHSTYYPP